MRYGSVCSGIEAASCAWESLGWQPAWFSEIEPFPSAVLAHHWPEVANLGDMTKIAAAISSGDVEAPDVLVGGTPCQAFSVAGLRAGLEDARGQLTLSYVELANAIDSKRRENGQQPAIIVWENVPGVLSSKDNAFGCFLGALAGESCELQPAGGKWSYAGCVSGPERTIAWRTLDAQFFGVAQRRRRVFVVASARNEFDPREVLFESEGVRRDIAPSREARSITAALTATGVGTCGADDNQAQAGHLVAGTLLNNGKAAGSATQQDAENGLLVTETYSSNGHASFTEGIGPLRAKSGADHESLTVTAFNWQAGGNTSATLGADEHVTGALQCNQTPAIAFSSKDYGGDATFELSPTLRAGNTDTSHMSGGQPPAVAYGIPGNWIGRSPENGGNSVEPLRNMSPCLTSTDRHAVSLEPMAVRRLTPRECERLQGMPDDHTLIPYGKAIRPEKLAEDYAKYLMRGGRMKTLEECCTAASDSNRYKAIGNSMAVPVMAWIGTRIDMAINISVESIEKIVTEEVSEIAESDSTALSNKYVLALHELRDKPAHKLKEVGDQWRTPDSLFWGINAMFGPLVLDLFTDGENSKCPAFYTAEDNAITQDWSARLSELNGAAFANPPYSRASKHDGQYITGMSHIINHAFQMRELGGRYVFLIKAATSETWWPEGADHVSFVRGRIGFDAPSWFVPADKDQVPTGAFFAGAIVVFDKTWRGPAISYVSREQLLAQGEAFLEQIRWQAARLNNSTSEVAA
ncbi:phage N-6-adenine-methyltransferase [Rahnella sp. ChDrAdgB13]|uniref:phage N-6-adenine-methyltransferase n=1 Tax=Rahnella sp. ChDrAdgB13 TaxID=1850581 RepID=UPI0027DD631B|nr:phage N-6-adenine-methyltransferase [Rahnella sp. ChDrAdgB13]